MGAALPIIQQLLDLIDDRERGDWLKRLPPALMLHERGALAEHFHALRWQEACAYIDAVTSAMSGVRMGTGELRPAVRRVLETATRALDDSVVTRRGRRERDAAGIVFESPPCTHLSGRLGGSRP